MSAIYREVGERIRAKRLRLGLTLEDLAEMTGLHASYIGQIERNTKKASLETVAVVAKALGVPVTRLFSDAALTPKARYSDQLDLILRLAGEKKKALVLDVLRRLAQGLRELN